MTHTYTYTHDPAGRLVRVERDGVVVEECGYDARGNRTSAAYDGGGAAAASYDAQDRILARAGTSYVVDVDGFLAARGGDTFTYSATGELLEASVGGTTVTYDYDAARRPVRRTAGGQSTELFYVDPFDAFRPGAYRAPGEALTVLRYDDAGLLVALERGPSRWIVATDHLGSPRVVIDEATGTVVKTLRYDAFGRMLSDSNPAFVLPIGFAGGIQDPTTRLVRFGLRDYEPASGRWTARDPIFLAGGQMNLYEYVGSSPVRFRDPMGLLCIGASGFLGIGGGGKVCVTPDGVSACGELGVGLGESIDVNPWGNLDGDFFGTEAGLKANVLGIASAGCEGSYGFSNLDDIGLDPCKQSTDGDCKAGLLGNELSAFKGMPGDSVGLWDAYKNADSLLTKREFKPKVFELQGKVTAKLCAKLNL